MYGLQLCNIYLFLFILKVRIIKYWYYVVSHCLKMWSNAVMRTYLRGSVDVENGQKRRKTWNYDPLTILGKNISKIKKKKVEKVKKLPKNQYLATPYFLLPVLCFHDFVSFIWNFIAWKLTCGLSNHGYLCVQKTKYFSTNIPKKFKGMDEMAKKLGKH